jgi:hypothetical protein
MEGVGQILFSISLFNEKNLLRGSYIMKNGLMKNDNFNVVYNSGKSFDVFDQVRAKDHGWRTDNRWTHSFLQYHQASAIAS